LHVTVTVPCDVYDDVTYVYDDVTYVYDDVTYVYDDVTYVYDDVHCHAPSRYRAMYYSPSAD
jgi:hypothetical protein